MYILIVMLSIYQLHRVSLCSRGLGRRTQWRAKCPRVCVPPEERTCPKCEKTAVELGLKWDNEKTRYRIESVIARHSGNCTSKQDWTEVVAKLAKKPRPGPNGKVGFSQKTDKKLYNKIRIATGLQGNAVSGERRADLEQLGYTVENGFFPDTL